MSISPRLGSLHGKSVGLVSQCKSLLSDQHNRLANKHSLDVDLLDDVRTFIKAKCNIERDYAQALIKLSASHQNKKYQPFACENDSDIKSLYTAWKIYMEEVEKSSKNRLAQFENFGAICETLKQMKTRKVQIGKKQIDQHHKRMMEEILTSVAEIDKTKKLYFDEEHLAKQARDKEEKIKKRKAGIFASVANLKTKKEKTSAFREATDIQSTQARNEYIMALAAGNAHLEHYFQLDLPALMQTTDDNALDICKGFMLQILQSDLNALLSCTESAEKSNLLVQSSSADFTNAAFLSEPASQSLSEPMMYDFEPCENDSVTVVSLDFNADHALKNEVQKWLTWYTKECRNWNRLSTILVTCQSYAAEGHKTIEVNGQPVEIETRIDDIKQQIRKCEISKIKAKAKLDAIKISGLEMENYEHVEDKVVTEMKQISLDVDIGIGQPLSRTPSLRSANISALSGDGGRISSLDGGKYSSDHDTDSKDQTPEPDLSGRSGRSGRPESSSSDQLESPEREQLSYQAYDAGASWGDDPTAAWTDEPAQLAQMANVEVGALPNASQEYESVDYANYDQQQVVEVDGFQLVNKLCKALYEYNSENTDDLCFIEGEILTIIEGCDKDWVKARNDKYMTGFVPAAYLEIVGDAIQEEPITEKQENAVEDSYSNVQGEELTDSVYAKALYDYTATSAEELSFYEGDLIKIIDKSDDGWWTGEKDGIQGHFPSILVEDTEGNGAFENSGSEEEEEEEEEEEDEESVKCPLSAVPIAPPPSFAPPKPAYLTPHQVIITQATPDVERRSALGEEVEEKEGGEMEGEHESEDKDGDINEEGETSTSVVVEIMNPEFTLEKPTKKIEEGENDSEMKECEDGDGKDERREEFGRMSPPSPAPPDVNINVSQSIEANAEEIVQAITNEAISEAVRESSQENVSAVDDCKNGEIMNEESDYEDLK